MEEIEYAEMLEIPVSTVNVVRSKRRRKKETQDIQPALKDSVIASVNDRLQDEEALPNDDADVKEGALHFDPIPERIDTVRLYATGEDGELNPYDYPLNEGGKYETNEKIPRSVRVALGVEFGVACALCCGIFLTNVLLPTSAINTFFRAINTPVETPAVRPYTDFELGAVVSELSSAKLNLSPSGILSFTDECCVYPAADGKVASVSQDLNGKTTLKIEYTKDFTGVVSGLDTVYYAVGDDVKANVPVGYTNGEAEVQITMYSGGILLNCFELTEENCLAWIADSE